MSPQQLAVNTGATHYYIKGVLAGEYLITSDFALALEKEFGASAKFWLNLQRNYEREFEEAFVASVACNNQITK